MKEKENNPSQLKILFRECSNSGTVQDCLDQQISKQQFELKIMQ